MFSIDCVHLHLRLQMGLFMCVALRRLNNSVDVQKIHFNLTLVSITP